MMDDSLRVAQLEYEVFRLREVVMFLLKKGMPLGDDGCVYRVTEEDVESIKKINGILQTHHNDYCKRYENVQTTAEDVLKGGK